MNKVLSPKTAARLREVIGRVPGDGVGPARSRGTRRVCFVQVIGSADAEGYHPCLPLNYVTGDGAWEEYDVGKLAHPNGEKLLVGCRYLAVRAGDHADGSAVFVTGCCDEFYSASDDQGGNLGAPGVFVSYPTVPAGTEGNTLVVAVVFSRGGQPLPANALGEWTLLSRFTDDDWTFADPDNALVAYKIRGGPLDLGDTWDVPLGQSLDALLFALPFHCAPAAWSYRKSGSGEPIVGASIDVPCQPSTLLFVACSQGVDLISGPVPGPAGTDEVMTWSTNQVGGAWAQPACIGATGTRSVDVAPFALGNLVPYGHGIMLALPRSCCP